MRSLKEKTQMTITKYWNFPKHGNETRNRSHKINGIKKYGDWERTKKQQKN